MNLIYLLLKMLLVVLPALIAVAYITVIERKVLAGILPFTLKGSILIILTGTTILLLLGVCGEIPAYLFIHEMNYDNLNLNFVRSTAYYISDVELDGSNYEGSIRTSSQVDLDSNYQGSLIGSDSYSDILLGWNSPVLNTTPDPNFKVRQIISELLRHQVAWLYQVPGIERFRPKLSPITELEEPTLSPITENEETDSVHTTVENETLDAPIEVVSSIKRIARFIVRLISCGE